MKPNLFNSIKLMRPKRSMFDLTHDIKLSTDMGRLTPVMALECVPGDKFNISGQALVRFAPLIAPVMHRFDVCIHYFFVPNRILWSNWEQWITGNYDGAAPYFTGMHLNSSSLLATSGLANYLGVPVSVPNTTGFKVSGLPFAAYQKIYDEYYRDENLVPSVWKELIDGSNDSSDTAALSHPFTSLRIRAWEHDYFTASLPFAQKGAAVEIPLGSVNAQVNFDTNNWPGKDAADVNVTLQPGTDAETFSIPGSPNPNTTTEADLWVSGDVEPTTINSLRRAEALQKWLERNARGGTRYFESIWSHFGVKSPDARLQRPEYITGVKTPITISEVLNTAGASDSPVQGNMAGHGIGVADGKFGKYYCQEHGWIMGIMSIMPKPAYQQGLHRKFSKFDTLDYYWPSFAHIGEQEVLQQEVYAASSNGSATFGYVPRYAEYKFEQNRVAGDFQTSLNFWHDGRIFSSDPALNQAFIECVPDKRIFAVTESNVDSLYVQVLNKVVASRPMPKFGTPHL